MLFIEFAVFFLEKRINYGSFFLSSEKKGKFHLFFYVKLRSFVVDKRNLTILEKRAGKIDNLGNDENEREFRITIT